MHTIPDTVLETFGIDKENASISALDEGLINHTWKVVQQDRSYILQRVNDRVFRQPWDIAHNIEAIDQFLKQHHPDYYFVSPVHARDGKPLIFAEGAGYFRMFPFVPGSHTLRTVETPDEAFQAARQFGTFTAMLEGFPVAQLKLTIPSFHDLSLRFDQFREALAHGNKQRAREAGKLCQQLQEWSHIVDEFEKIRANPGFRKRVTHHDTKISNILFDDRDHGICVIDLDTVMPGYFISDVGDMMRTYLCPINEEEKDLSRIEIRDEYYHAIRSGYMECMGDLLGSGEQDHFFYAGSFLMYMQAIRFLTDYLNNDRYYGSKYPGHNLVRAQNQTVLLSRYLEKESLLHA